MKELLIDTVASPIGKIVIVADDTRMCALDFADYEDRMMKLLERRYDRIRFKKTDDPNGFSSRVKHYFGGEIDALQSIPVTTHGTPFQQMVWGALRDIPAGSRTTYRAWRKRLAGQPLCVPSDRQMP